MIKPRTREIEIGGVKLTIASLSLSQGRRLEEERQKLDLERLDKTNPLAVNKGTRLMLEFVVCASLNRALGDVAEDQKWTVERCENELDWALIDGLIKEIMNFSGTAQEVNGQVERTGEIQAALTSQPSAAA